MTTAYFTIFLGALVVVAAQEKGRYKAWLESITTCDNQDQPVGDISTIKVSQYNSTNVVITGDMKVMETVDKNATMKLIVYKRSAHGSWTKTGVETKTLRVCDFLKTDQYVWPAIVSNSNLPATCPIAPKTYTFKDAALTLNQLPPFLPLGCYKVVCDIKAGDRRSCNSFFGKVTSPEGSPRPRCEQ